MIEYDDEKRGMGVQCPHCHQLTILKNKLPDTQNNPREFLQLEEMHSVLVHGWDR
jgi:hypothetical protein